MAEPNNLIAEATDSGISALGELNTILNGSIDSITDIDLYQFQLDRGQGITLDIDTVNAANNTSNFDSYLRVFNAEGEELTFNDDFSLESEEFSLDSYIGFIANQTGEYYVGVSSVANNSYNPINGNNINQFQDNFVPGDYDLTFNVVEVIADEDPDNTISEAIALNLDSVTVVDGNIETESDVDVFQVELAQGEGIKLKANAKAIDSNLDPYLRVFDELGNQLAFDDNSINNPDVEITTDSTIDFAPQTPGEYYIGLSSAGNFNYDPINGNTNLNFFPNNGFSQGNYQLQLDIVEVVPDEDPDNTIAEAIDSGVSSTGVKQGLVSGEINPELDVDIYKIQLEAGDGIYLNLDAKNIGSDLDSLLRIFDATGNQLTIDDDDDANFTGDFSSDSAIAFAPNAAGEYYIGVSDAGNFDYDPVNGRTNFSSNVISPFSTVGNYDLQINILNVVTDEDTDNTIAEAVDSGVSSTGETSTVLSAIIDPASDIDLYKFQLAAGEGVTLNINAAVQDSDLDSYLRLFDGEGNELAFDDDDDQNVVREDTTADSLINFVAETSGEYYVGVSSEGNTSYDAIAGSDNFNATSGLSVGEYELAIDIAPVTGDLDPDNTISEAVELGVDITGERSQSISNAIDSPADVDLYQFQLNRGNTVTLDIDAAIIGSSLDSVLQLFDSDGKAIVNNDDGTAENENSSLDSLIEFTATADGIYYVGVSSFANFDYNAIDGSNNFSNDIGSSTGNYDLIVSINNS